MMSRVDHYFSKLLAGIELTAMYALTRGNNYPPLDQDVTFWCVIP